MKRVASRPKAARSTFQSLSSREVLLLGILAVWRADMLFHLKNLTAADIEDYMHTCSKVWDAPMDMSVKLARATGFYMMAEKLYNAPPSEPPDLFVNLYLDFFRVML